jgi:signal transduction histidine kinase/ligand-binding sensor domain-containing protein
MRLGHTISLTIFLVLFSCFAFAQNNFRFKNISINQGLSQSTVSSTIEDSRGILWFATFDGLNKYDGKSFKVYRAQGASAIRLKSSKINKLFLAQNDQLFIYSDGGLDILDLKTEKLINNELNETYKVNAPCIYDNEHIVFSDATLNLKLYNPFTGKINNLLSYAHDKDFTNALSKIKVYGNKLILVSKKNNILVVDKKGKIVHRYKVNDILQEAQVHKDVLFVSTRKIGLVEINLKSHKTQVYTHSFGILNMVKTMLIDKQFYALSYGQGMLVMDTVKKTIEEIDNKLEENTYITSGYQDQQKNVWIGTDGSGLNFFNKSQLIFDNITPQHLGSVRGIADGGSKIYIATFSDGCYSYDLKSKQTEKIYHNPNKICNAIAYDHGKLWIGYDHNGVDIFDLASKKIIHSIPYLQKSLLAQFKSRIYRIDNFDEEHMVISTRWEGMALVNKRNYEITNKINQETTALRSSDIRHVVLSRDKQKVYVGSVYEGLVVFSYPDFKLIKNVQLTKKEQAKISVKHIREDAEENIWLGTNGTGIIILNKNFEQIAHWNTTNYLKNDVVYSSLTENKNSIWLSSNEGITRIQYNLKDQESIIKDIQNFNINNGLQSNEFNTGAYCRTANGYIAFGGLNNVNVFNPRQLKFDRRNGQVRITDFFVKNKALKTDKVVHYLNEIELEPSQNDIGLSFIVPGYNDGIEIEYRYRLKGYQSNWQYIGSRNNIDFTNLPSGSYQFQVQSRYLNNFWSKDVTELTIKINTPFYKTWWFYLLLLIGIMLLIGSLIRLRINYIKSTNKNKLRLMIESQEIERSRISRELHDDFGGRLSTLKLHMEAIKLQPEQAKEIAQSTTKIIDQSIVELRNILLNLSPKTLTDDGLEIALQEIANSINKTKLLQITSSYSLKTDLKPSAAISIYRIVFELINNTIKHAEANQIDISLTQREDVLVLHYEDNGIGLQSQSKSKGYGLSNIQNHLQVHDAKSYIDSEKGQGYHFTAEFPLDILN